MKLKTGIYISKSTGELMLLEKIRLEKVYDALTGKTEVLITGYITSIDIPPIYKFVISKESIKDLKYLGKLCK